MTHIYEGFFGRQVMWTVGSSESNGCGFVTLGIPGSLRAINKGWEQLRLTRLSLFELRHSESTDQSQFAFFVRPKVSNVCSFASKLSF